MQKFTLRTVVTAVLFLFAAAYIFFVWLPSGATLPPGPSADDTVVSDVTYWQRTRGERTIQVHYPVSLAQDLHQLPLEIGEWVGHEVPQSDVNALVMLEPEQFVERLYQNQNGEYVWLTLIGSRQSRSFHPPSDCYYAAGWENEAQPVQIAIDDGEILGTLIQARRTTEYAALEQVSFYFYLFPNARRNLSDGVIMFRITSGLYGTVDETIKVLGAFLNRFFSGVTSAAQPPPYQEVEAHPTANEARLEGYRFSRQLLPADGVLGVDLRWFAVDQPQRRYQSVLRVRDENGRLWSENESHFSDAYDFPLLTTEWAANNYYWDRQEVALLPGTPPGSYQVWLTRYDYEQQRPLTFVANNNELPGSELFLGTIELVDPIAPMTVPTEVAPTSDWHKYGVRLAGFTHDAVQLQPGDPFTLTFFWEKTAPLTFVSQVHVALQNDAGRVAASWKLPMVNEDFPPFAWEQGSRWRGQHILHLPVDVASGEYQLLLDNVLLDAVQVDAPDRVFTVPVYETAVSATFADQITLVGYSIGEDGRFQFVWQANTEMSTSYHVFLHAVDGTGKILAQSDGVPSDWSRPTTGWQAGEVVIDEHTLSSELLTQPDITFRIGLYNPETGERLLTPQGDHILLP